MACPIRLDPSGPPPTPISWGPGHCLNIHRLPGILEWQDKAPHQKTGVGNDLKVWRTDSYQKWCSYHFNPFQWFLPADLLSLGMLFNTSTRFKYYIMCIYIYILCIDIFFSCSMWKSNACTAPWCVMLNNWLVISEITNFLHWHIIEILYI